MIVLSSDSFTAIRPFRFIAAHPRTAVSGGSLAYMFRLIDAIFL